MDAINEQGIPKQKHEPAGEDFWRLLARLDADPGRALEFYQHLRQQLVAFFLKRGPQFEAEDLADRALDAIAKKPDSYEIRNLREFAIGVARYLKMESARKHSTTIQLSYESEFPGRDRNPEHTLLDKIDADRKIGCFLKCIQRMQPMERRLILEYYPAESCNLEHRRRQLAQTLGIEAGALTMRMNRLRAKLAKCCEYCYLRVT